MIEPCVNIITDPNGRELIPHGTEGFPAACYGMDRLREAAAWHWHSDFELMFVLDGKREICLEREHHVIGAGDAIFVNSAGLHYSAPFGEDPPSARWILFHPRLIGGIDSVFYRSFVQPVIDCRSMKGRVFRSSVEADGRALTYISSALRGFSEPSAGCEIDIREALSRLMLILSEEAKSDARTPSTKSLRESERVRTMLRFIEEHYADDITAADIADSASVSVSESLRCFRSIIGMPPVRYLIRYRVQTAAEKLTADDEQISSIAMECGFGEMSYFARAFREVMGSTPSEYRCLKKSGQSETTHSLQA